MIMAQEDLKIGVRQQRIALVRALKLRDNYQRTHTATGVLRRKDLLGEGVEVREAQVNERSLANLQKRRGGARG